MNVRGAVGTLLIIPLQSHGIYGWRLPPVFVIVSFRGHLSVGVRYPTFTGWLPEMFYINWAFRREPVAILRVIICVRVRWIDIFLNIIEEFISVRVRWLACDASIHSRLKRQHSLIPEEVSIIRMRAPPVPKVIKGRLQVRLLLSPPSGQARRDLGQCVS